MSLLNVKTHFCECASTFPLGKMSSKKFNDKIHPSFIFCNPHNSLTAALEAGDYFTMSHCWI